MAIVKDLGRPESIIDLPISEKITNNSRVANAVTPSDTADLPLVYRHFVIGVGGTITFMRWDGTLVPYTAIAGQKISLLARRVMATGTAATNIVAEN